MSTTIQSSYINALLADAAYVKLSENGTLLPDSTQNENIASRLTQPQADFITANFEVVNQELSVTGGFDATVWRIKAGSGLAGSNNENAGKVYVSMRGTQGSADLADDAQLATSGVPNDQIVAMVNWWLKATTAPDQQAQQIQYGPVGTGVTNPDTGAEIMVDIRYGPNFIAPPPAIALLTTVALGLIVFRNSEVSKFNSAYVVDINKQMV